MDRPPSNSNSYLVTMGVGVFIGVLLVETETVADLMLMLMSRSPGQVEGMEEGEQDQEVPEAPSPLEEGDRGEEEVEYNDNERRDLLNFVSRCTGVFWRKQSTML